MFIANAPSYINTRVKCCITWWKSVSHIFHAEVVSWCETYSPRSRNRAHRKISFAGQCRFQTKIHVRINFTPRMFLFRIKTMRSIFTAITRHESISFVFCKPEINYATNVASGLFLSSHMKSLWDGNCGDLILTIARFYLANRFREKWSSAKIIQ